MRLFCKHGFWFLRAGVVYQQNSNLLYEFWFQTQIISKYQFDRKNLSSHVRQIFVVIVYKFFEYRTRAIITRGLYSFYPLFEVQKRFFKGFFLKILDLCMVS